ncbi:MAG: prolipoprotein diacylglyceryl transferase [Opitutae bacterium]|nr:prolipoprotein diacylglyceryl transferase [Opitutae bacterium]
MPAEAQYWVHDLSPFIYEFPEGFRDWGPGGIRWYGISYLCGFVAAGMLLRLFRKKNRSPYEPEQILNLLTFQVLGVLLGGRVGHAFLYNWPKLIEDPLMLFRVWEGGMSSHGGFIGVCIATLWYARVSKQSPFPIGDLIVCVVPPGLCFGRIANFINGELWGRPTEVSWGILFPHAPDFAEGIARHPSQLYAAALEGLLTFTYIQWRFWKTNISTRVPGRLSGEFLVVYAFARIADEFFREPDASLILGMSRGQFYSLFLAAGGIALIMLAEKIASRITVTGESKD